MRNLTIAALCCTLAAGTGFGQTTTGTLLLVGDAAPGLRGVQWVAGDPVGGFEKGKVYVLEFGSGGDAAYLGELQTLYRDQGVIVINVQQGSATAPAGGAYRVATDGEGAEAGWRETWLRPERAGGGVPPVSYVVDRDGRIAYIGGRGEVPAVVESVVAGTWKPEARFGTREAQMVQIKLSKNEVDEAMAMLEKMEKEPGQAPWVIPQYFYILAAVKKDPAAAKAYAERMAAAPDADPEVIVKFVETLLGSEVSNPDLELAGRLLERAEQLAAGKAGMQGRIEAVRFELLLKKGDAAGAGELAAKMADAAEADAATLNRMALAITNSQPPTRKGLLPLAEKMALRANELAAGNADYIGTQARVMAEQGNYARAIELQTQAVAAAKPWVKRDFEGTLEEYRMRAGGRR